MNDLSGILAELHSDGIDIIALPNRSWALACSPEQRDDPRIAPVLAELCRRRLERTREVLSGPPPPQREVVEGWCPVCGEMIPPEHRVEEPPVTLFPQSQATN